MAKIELAQFTTPYEFEERATLFGDMVLTLAKRYRSFDITVGNLTLERMLDLQKSIAKTEHKKINFSKNFIRWNINTKWNLLIKTQSS